MPTSSGPSGPGDKNLPVILGLLDGLGPAIEHGDRSRQNDIIRQLLELRAPMGQQWQQLALLAAGNGELRIARRAIDTLVEAMGRTSEVLYQRAVLLTLLGDWREAEAQLLALPADVPDPVANAYSRGIAALNLGRPGEARDWLERTVRARPQAGQAWLALSMTSDLANEPELAGLIVAAERDISAAPVNEQAAFYHALGKTYADLGEAGQAFAAVSRGAALIKDAVAYDAAADAAEASAATDGFTPQRLAALASRQDEPTGRAIFVSGLPRSGTTLVQQILTAHGSVAHGDEIARLQFLAHETGGASYSALAGFVAAGKAGSAARLWAHWLDELFPAPGRVVDKTVDAGRLLGIAAALLPEAPLVWVTRDPLDRAWSCFRTNFAGAAMPWSYDLRDIAAHFRIEDRLLDQWRDLLGERLLVVPYEGLVSEPEPWTRRLLDHCGLAEEAGVYSPHTSANPVATASSAQVRQPIHRGGVGSAAPYRAFLQPFLDAYGA